MKSRFVIQTISLLFVATVSSFEGNGANNVMSHTENLKIVCKAFNISLDKCTCKMFSTKGDGPNYCKENANYETPQRVLVYLPEISIPIAIIACFFSIIGIVGNSAVVMVTKEKTDAINFYLLIRLLALSDLLFSLMQFIESVPLFWTNQWIFKGFLCKCFRGAKAMGDYLYIGFVILLAIERYLMVVRSAKKTSKKKIYSAALVNLLFATIAAFPIFIVYGVDDIGRCEENWENGPTDSSVYNWIIIALYVVLSPLCAVYLCLRIHEAVKVQMSLNHIDVTQLHVNTSRKSRGNQKILKIIVAMVTAFVLCNLPNRIAWIYISSKNYEMSDHSYKIIVFVAKITYTLLVCINPIIYSVIDATWRRDIKNVLMCRHVEIEHGIDNEKGFTVKNKSFDALKVSNLNTRKAEKTRNLSIDHGTHLLSYNDMYFTMPNKTEKLNSHS